MLFMFHIMNVLTLFFVFTNQLINNYWMRLSGISRIIEAEVGVICRSPQAEADNANRGLNNSRYPAKTEFNNYFIIHMDCFIIHMDHFIINMG